MVFPRILDSSAALLWKPQILQVESLPACLLDPVTFTGLHPKRVSPFEVFIYTYKIVHISVLESVLTPPVGCVTIWKYLAYWIFKTYFLFCKVN
jgi:hypothetical protein